MRGCSLQAFPFSPRLRVFGPITKVVTCGTHKAAITLGKNAKCDPRATQQVDSCDITEVLSYIPGTQTSIYSSTSSIYELRVTACPVSDDIRKVSHVHITTSRPTYFSMYFIRTAADHLPGRHQHAVMRCSPGCAYRTAVQILLRKHALL